MLNNKKIVSICLCVSGLSGCTIDDTGGYQDYQPNTYYQSNTYSSTQLYPEGYESNSYAEIPQEKKQVEVPDTYLAGATRTPTSHSSMDKDWVHRQNAQGYTIELADGDKASQVAGALYKAPKNERTAEVKYQHGGKTYYKGLYGSYPNYESAQKALNTLPDDIKQNAGIKTWGSVQSGVSE